MIIEDLKDSNINIVLSFESGDKITILVYISQDGNRNRVPSTDRVEVDRDSGNIHFRPLMKDDEGQYECVATNDVGEARGTGYLKVFGK